jgi:CTP synthase
LSLIRLQIACRLLVQKPVAQATKEKISMFCHVTPEQVIGVHDLDTVYGVPLLLRNQGLLGYLTKRMGLGSIQIAPAMVQKGASLLIKWEEVTA